MRRVLIVSPSFPPTNAADMHRVRQSLPYLEENGWEATVLAVDPDFCDQPRDERLLETIPRTVRVERVRAVSSRVTRRLGFGSLAIRAYPFLWRAGTRLLSSSRFDLVFFSTTMFATIGLGPGWKRRFGVPFVIDLQDPWWSDYHSGPDAPPPPGGRLKYGISQRIAAFQERHAMRSVSQVISVSPGYPELLLDRYAWMRREQFAVLPFGADAVDFRVVERANVTQEVFDPRDGNRHWVYVGRAGDDMALALGGFFQALARARSEHPDRFRNLSLHFVGTSYAHDHRAIPTVMPLAERHGLGELVREHPRRIPYFAGLRCLLDAEALIVPGSDDPGYTASKIYPYILAARPLLAIFHERSSVVDVLRATRGGEIVEFGSASTVEDVANRISDVWFRAAPKLPGTDWTAFEAYSAREMTRRQCEVFDRALGT